MPPTLQAFLSTAMLVVVVVLLLQAFSIALVGPVATALLALGAGALLAGVVATAGRR